MFRCFCQEQVIKCLLIEPFPQSALNEEAGKLFMENWAEYFKQASLYTQVHALKKPGTGCGEAKGDLSLQRKMEMSVSKENVRDSMKKIRGEENDLEKPILWASDLPGEEILTEQFNKGNKKQQNEEDKCNGNTCEGSLASGTGATNKNNGPAASNITKKKWMKRI